MQIACVANCTCYKLSCCQKLSKIAKNCQKLPKVAKSCQQWPTVVNSCQKLPTVANSCQQLLKDAKSCQKLTWLQTYVRTDRWASWAAVAAKNIKSFWSRAQTKIIKADNDRVYFVITLGNVRWRRHYISIHYRPSRTDLSGIEMRNNQVSGAIYCVWGYNGLCLGLYIVSGAIMYCVCGYILCLGLYTRYGTIYCVWAIYCVWGYNVLCLGLYTRYGAIYCVWGYVLCLGLYARYGAIYCVWGYILCLGLYTGCGSIIYCV